ncbi:unnamed protein product [Caenorhabditis auriculariae]|uniref:Peptidase C1A papain C-terminal domain-containing protein n=1 Tax=Caenorhabditis auriculariae TaxID=2777116 RepID=A0A8S1HV57_9PELO|nr:unnamed protein product [Caenorhabditis auriculariae]
MLGTISKAVFHKESYAVDEPGWKGGPEEELEPLDPDASFLSENLERKGSKKYGKYNVSFCEEVTPIPIERRKSKCHKFACLFCVLCSLLIVFTGLLFSVIYFSYIPFYPYAEHQRFYFKSLAPDCSNRTADNLKEFELYHTGEFGHSYQSQWAVCEGFMAFNENRHRIDEYNKNNKIRLLNSDAAKFGITIFTDWNREKRRTQVSPSEETALPNSAPKAETINGRYGVAVPVDWMDGLYVGATPAEAAPTRPQRAPERPGPRSVRGDRRWAAVAMLQKLQFAARNRSFNVALANPDKYNMTDNPRFEEEQDRLTLYSPLLITDGNSSFGDLSPPKLYKGQLDQPAIFSVKDSRSSSTETDLLTYVANYGPALSSICVPEFLFDYTTGIFSYDQCNSTETLGFIPVIIVGFGVEDNVKFWKVLGWWGTNWGEHGFFRIERGRGACCLGVSAPIMVDREPIPRRS